MGILCCQHFPATVSAHVVAVLVINYPVLVAHHSKLPFSNLSNPELMSPSHGISCIYFTLVFSIMTMLGFDV